MNYIANYKTLFTYINFYKNTKFALDYSQDYESFEIIVYEGCVFKKLIDENKTYFTSIRLDVREDIFNALGIKSYELYCQL